MKKGTQVVVTMTRGPQRTGKYVRGESNRGAWYVIKGPDGGEFKARPSKVRPA